MATRKCKDSDTQASKHSKQCPHCGAPVKKKSGCLGIIGIISSTLDDSSSPPPAQPAVAPDLKEKPKPTPPVASKPKHPHTTPDWKARPAEFKAQYLPEFQTPTVRSRISLKLKSGSTQEAVTKSLMIDNEDPVYFQTVSTLHNNTEYRIPQTVVFLNKEA
jgi:hypothetical protein